MLCSLHGKTSIGEHFADFFILFVNTMKIFALGPSLFKRILWAPGWLS